MNSFSNSEMPISETDRAEIVALFIELLRERDRAEQSFAENLNLPFLSPPGNEQGLRSEWGTP